MPELLDMLSESDQAVIITPGDSQDRDSRFELACKLSATNRVEMDEKGNIILTPGNSEDSSFRSCEASRQLANWARQDGTGRAFDATANFNLPSGAKRQPDAAWVPKAVLQKEGAAALRTITKTRHVPAFVIEVTSPSDVLREQEERCVKWIEAGVREAVLLHPKTRTAYIYTSDGTVEMLEAKKITSKILVEFVLDCDLIWEDL